MTFSVAHLKNALESLHNTAAAGMTAFEEECEEFEDWLNTVKDAVIKGNLSSIGLLPKTPGKKRGILGTINESTSNTSQLDVQPEPQEMQKKPRNSRKISDRPQSKRKQELSTDEDQTSSNDNDSLSKRRRALEKQENLPVINITDAEDEVNGDNGNASSSERSCNQRLTRTRWTKQRTTIVKETWETFDKKSSKEHFMPQPPVLRSPSPIDLTTPEPFTHFKSPRLLKPLRQIAALERDEAPPMDVEVNHPPLRMTRTKTRAMAKAAQKETPKSPSEEKSTGNESEQDSESTMTSVGSVISRPGVTSFVKQKIGTPLGKSNFLSHSQVGTPNSSNLITSVQSFIQKPAPASVKKDRQEEYLLKITQKTNEASKKREELIKAQTEEKMKKRQEKALKVNAAREALEKERADKLRQQMALEEERLEAKRRKLAQQKLAEAAEAARVAKRLQEEEQRRLAELEKRREIEEQKRLAEEKKRELEVRIAEERKREEEKRRLAEKRRQLEEQRRLAEERRKEQEEAERRKKEAEKAFAMKAKAILASTKPQLNETFVKPCDETFVHPSSYDMTPMSEDRKPAPSKTVDDYGIDDAGCDDSSEDESNPKKEVPLWAQGKNRMPHLICQYHIRHRQVATFFGSEKSTPDLSKIFRTIDKKILIRKSSAVWRTPPVKFNESIM